MGNGHFRQRAVALVAVVAMDVLLVGLDETPAGADAHGIGLIADALGDAALAPFTAASGDAVVDLSHATLEPKFGAEHERDDAHEDDHGGVGGSMWFAFEPTMSGQFTFEASPGFVVVAYQLEYVHVHYFHPGRFTPFIKVVPYGADQSTVASGEPVAVTTATPGVKQVYVVVQRTDETSPDEAEISWEFTPADAGTGDGIGVARYASWEIRQAAEGGLTDAFLDPFDLVADWNGDGIDQPVRATPPVFRMTERPGFPPSISYGRAGDTPLVGDWDGDGIDTVGIRRGNVFHLRNSNTTGVADLSFSYGRHSDVPVVGDWNGDGVDTIGVRRGTGWYLRNTNSKGVADTTFGYGYRNDDPIVGDWDGDGIDTIGVHRGRLWLLRNANTPGPPDRVFGFGYAGERPVVGNWDGL